MNQLTVINITDRHGLYNEAHKEFLSKKTSIRLYSHLLAIYGISVILCTLQTIWSFHSANEAIIRTRILSVYICSGT